MDNSVDKRKYLNRDSSIIVVSQICSMGVGFINVPLTLNILGVGSYGVWITLMSMIEWLNLFDFGFGHSLRNKFAEAKATERIDSLKGYVSTTFFVLLFISIILLIILLPIGYFLDWSIILNAPAVLKNDLGSLAIMMCVIFCVRFVTNIISTILNADQLPYIPAIISLAGNILSLISLIFLKSYFNGSILWVGVSLSVSQVLPLVVAFFILFSTKYKSLLPHIKYFSKEKLSEVFNLGLRFFFIQITNLLLIYSNSFIISHSVGNSEVTEFNLAYRYLNVLNVVFMAILTPYWSTFTQAYARGENEWICGKIRYLNYVWIVISLSGFIAIIISPFVYKLWVGDAVSPDYLLNTLLLLYFVFTMRYLIYRTFMNGVGKIKLQFIITSIEALLHIPIAIVLSSYLGIYGAVISMILWALFNSIWEPIQFRRIINNKAKKLWNS